MCADFAARARWAARRAAASETGANDGAWLDGDAAAAVACEVHHTTHKASDGKTSVKDCVRCVRSTTRSSFTGGAGRWW